jgi:hypothetical protein
VLHGLGGRVEAAGRDRVELARLERRDVALAIVSFAATTASISLSDFCSICSKIVSAFWPSQLGTACCETLRYSPDSNFGLRTSP